MCPSCISAAASVVAGVASTGGMAAMAMAVLRRRGEKADSQRTSIEIDTNTSDKETDDAAAENRNPR